MEIEASEISKTKRKEHMDQLQKLGMQLIKLNKDQLTQLNLPPILFEAIVLAQKLNANGAIRRQNQYIGKLMRQVDEEHVRLKLAEFNGESHLSTKLLHDCEAWREKLLASDKDLEEFIAQYQIQDVNEIRSLIRVCRKEILNKQNKSFRKLYKYIRNIVAVEQK
ncbi:MAG: DUF615 domain-containing protein [Burkholderiales bacterium]|nr:DUF615 domain-containing protein [Burkholderiales bacterium]